jgi:hypothetical protein
MQIIIIAPQGAGKTAVAEKIRAALGDEYTIVDETPRMVSPSPLTEIFTSSGSWMLYMGDSKTKELPPFVIPFLGHVPEGFIARQIGWPQISVRRRRTDLGIEALPVGSPTKDGLAQQAAAKRAFLAAKMAAGFTTPTDE